MTTVILRTTTRIVLPINLLVSAALFLQGHNAPGGGFIAGVLTSVGVGLVYISYDLEFLEREVFDRSVDEVVAHIDHGLVADYRRAFALGLAVAAGAGLAAVALGYPFLTHDYRKLHHVLLFGEVELASAVLFDLGVYAVVVGALLTILSVVGAE